MSWLNEAVTRGDVIFFAVGFFGWHIVREVFWRD